MCKVAVIGNCQAEQLIKIINSATNQIFVYDLPANYLATEGHRDAFEDVYRQADVIFIQHTPGAAVRRFCQHSYAREVAGNVFVWPNVYFDGYSPDISYLRAGGVIVPGPIGGYHSKFIREKFLEGRAIEEAIDLYSGPSYADAYGGSFARSLDALRAREQECDVAVSNIIEEHARGTKLFLTPNHQTNFVLSLMLSELCHLAGIHLATKDAAIPGINDLTIPANPYLLQREGCTFADPDGFIAKMPTGDFVTFSQADIIRGFYEIYQGMDREHLQNGVSV